MTDFIKDAIRTEAPPTEEVLARLEECGPFLSRYFDVVFPIIQIIDAVKKYIYYGKDEITDTDLYKSYSHIGARFADVKQNYKNVRIMHGILGIIGEAAELMPVMNDIVRRASYDNTNLIEEVFDAVGRYIATGVEPRSKSSK